MKQGQITISRTFDAIVDAGVDPADTRRLADQVDAVCAYIDSRPDIFGGPVDRSTRVYAGAWPCDADLHSDVWHVMESIWMVQAVLADEWEYLYDEAKVARKEAEIARKREEQG